MSKGKKPPAAKVPAASSTQRPAQSPGKQAASACKQSAAGKQIDSKSESGSKREDGAKGGDRASGGRLPRLITEYERMQQQKSERESWERKLNIAHEDERPPAAPAPCSKPIPVVSKWEDDHIRDHERHVYVPSESGSEVSPARFQFPFSANSLRKEAEGANRPFEEKRLPVVIGGQGAERTQNGDEVDKSDAVGGSKSGEGRGWKFAGASASAQKNLLEGHEHHHDVTVDGSGKRHERKHLDHHQDLLQQWRQEDEQAHLQQQPSQLQPKRPATANTHSGARCHPSHPHGAGGGRGNGKGTATSRTALAARWAKRAEERYHIPTLDRPRTAYADTKPVPDQQHFDKHHVRSSPHRGRFDRDPRNIGTTPRSQGGYFNTVDKSRRLRDQMSDDSFLQNLAARRIQRYFRTWRWWWKQNAQRILAWRKAALKIQRAWRTMLMRLHYQHLAATELQRYARGIYTRNFLRKSRAATVIQARIVGYQTRAKLCKLRSVAIAIQRVARGHQSRVSTIRMYTKATKAAVRIQCAIRNYLARRELRKREAARDFAIGTERSTRLVQRWFRGVNGRVVAKQVREERRQRLQELAAVTHIQSCYRRKRAFAKADRARNEWYRKKEHMATKIQAVFAGYMTRLWLEKIFK